MFTGLIERTGTVLALEEKAGARRIAISAPGIGSPGIGAPNIGAPNIGAPNIGAPGIRLRTGDSISVSGVCLTAVEVDAAAGRFAADLAAETVARTSLATLAPGSIVNLELPTPAGAPLGGHLVQGHVDGTGTLLSLTPMNPSAGPERTDWRLRLSIPENLSRYMVEKGSIAVEGISLTIGGWEPAAPEGAVVEIAIIPHTYAHTNLPSLKTGDPLNVEADVMLKFAERLRQHAAFEVTNAYLIANGY